MDKPPPTHVQNTCFSLSWESIQTLWPIFRTHDTPYSWAKTPPHKWDPSTSLQTPSDPEEARETGICHPSTPKVCEVGSFYSGLSLFLTSVKCVSVLGHCLALGDKHEVSLVRAYGMNLVFQARPDSTAERNHSLRQENLQSRRHPQVSTLPINPNHHRCSLRSAPQPSTHRILMHKTKEALSLKFNKTP